MNEKIECYKPNKTMCAKVIKNSVAESLTKTRFKRIFLSHDIITPSRQINHRERTKTAKKAVFTLYTHIIDINHHNICAIRPRRTCIAYFKPYGTANDSRLINRPSPFCSALLLRCRFSIFIYNFFLIFLFFIFFCLSVALCISIILYLPSVSPHNRTNVFLCTISHLR